MRKIIIFCIVLLIPAYMFSQTVKPETAKNAAVNWMFEHSNKKSADIKVSEMFVETINQDTLLYVFNFKDKGFIIVSGEQGVVPILGYSEKNGYKKDNQPSNFAGWMDNYKKQIQYAKQNKLKANETNENEWKRLTVSAKDFVKLSPPKDVGPLLLTEWDQGAGWNNYCPYDVASTAGNDHVWAGCVAVAMAQVMKFWNYPTAVSSIPGYTCPIYGTIPAVGYTEYNWSVMDNTTATDAAALLIYHCGVAVDMGYGYDGSGAYVGGANPSAIFSLENYLGFSTMATYELKSDWPLSTWINYIQTDINNGRPIIYGGQGTGGHAFNLDGYQGTDYFHFNWGWSGYYNGYFYLNDLTPGTHNYTNEQEAIFQIIPNVQCDVTLNASTTGNHEALCNVYLEPGFSSSGNFHARIIPDKKSITYAITKQSNVQITITDSQKTIVKTFERNNQSPGNYEIIWDCKNESGVLVSSGTYQYAVKTENNEQTGVIELTAK